MNKPIRIVKNLINTSLIFALHSPPANMQFTPWYNGVPQRHAPSAYHFHRAINYPVILNEARKGRSYVLLFPPKKKAHSFGVSFLCD